MIDLSKANSTLQLFPYARERSLTELQTQTSIIRIIRLAMDDDENYYVIVDQFTYERRVLSHFSTSYYGLIADMFGIVSAGSIPTPNFSLKCSLRWQDLPANLKLGFHHWHFHDFLPKLQDRHGYPRLYLGFKYFQPRGGHLDLLVDILKIMHGNYAATLRARRDEGHTVKLRNAYQQRKNSLP